MSSVVMQAEDISFRDEEVKDAHAQVVNMLRNILAFYELYKNNAGPASSASENLLDRGYSRGSAELFPQRTRSLRSL